MVRSWKKEIPEEEIIKRCKCCINCENIRNYCYNDVTKVVDCEIHGACGWFYWAKIMQTCDHYEPNFEGIMKEAIRKHEEEGNE
jgi:hypothetical protein